MTATTRTRTTGLGFYDDSSAEVAPNQELAALVGALGEERAHAE